MKISVSKSNNLVKTESQSEFKKWVLMGATLVKASLDHKDPLSLFPFI